MSEPVDTCKVFKELVHCFRCDEPFYFTLWAIAEKQSLACPQCGTDIDIADRAYQSLVGSVKARIAEISSFQCAPSGEHHLDLDRASYRLGHHPDFMSEHVVSITSSMRKVASSLRRTGAPSGNTARDQSPGRSPKSAISGILRLGGLDAAE
jgi:hypothetical protein